MQITSIPIEVKCEIDHISRIIKSGYRVICNNTEIIHPTKKTEIAKIVYKNNHIQQYLVKPL